MDCVCLDCSQLRLANGREDRLHLNDVIISDAASCNRSPAAERMRGALFPDGQAEQGSAGFICVLSPRVLEQEDKHKER